MKEIKTNEELSRVLGESENVLVKVGTSCCGPCGLVEARLEGLDGKVNCIIAKIDAEECSDDLLDSLSIRNVPTVIKYKNGQEVKRVCGVQTEESLKELAEE